MRVKGVRAAQAEATRAALLQGARELFAERGYAPVSVDEICAHAGVTKGALYHHFRDKPELFGAVFEEIQAEIVAACAASAAAAPNPWESLRAACETYLDLCLRRDVQQIAILDAPSVLGWRAWCDTDKDFGLGIFDDPLRRAVEARAIDPQPLEPLALLLLGALNTGARVMARSEDLVSARAQVGSTLDRLLSGIRAGKSRRR